MGCRLSRFVRLMAIAWWIVGVSAAGMPWVEFFSGASVLAAEPPFQVFRDFMWPQSGRYKERPLLVFSPEGERPENDRLRRPRRGKLPVALKGALRAEVCVEHWSGHVGTAEKRIRFNGHEWIDLPLPEGTPDRPECYFSAPTASFVEVPLSHLVEGENIFELTCGRQVCHNFHYPAFAVYGITLRVYVDPSDVSYPSGRIVAPIANASIGDFPVIEVEANAHGSEIHRVDVLARYEDFDWEGNGRFRQWHFDYATTQLRNHVGTATEPPYRVTWDTQWVADQRQPVALKAWITNAEGVTFETPIVRGLKLTRERRVRLYRATEIPQRFGTRAGQRKGCSIVVADDLTGATSARLVVASHGPHGEPGEFGLNDRRLGVVEPGLPGRTRKRFHPVAVPLDVVHQGKNRFYATSSTSEHALEILWPGPVLFVEFGKPTER